nr:PP2C family protein-serine/threonine phosphatase [Desulfobacterales bacterium]
ENISRLGSDHYMTMMVLRLNSSGITIAGKHQDLIIYRSALNRVETVTIPGTWLGIADNIKNELKDYDIEINKGDIVLLFTDGITEATNANGEMFGQEKLVQVLHKYADLPVRKLRNKIIAKVKAYQEEQVDDMTLVVIKK